jgi:hypothetical protein
MFSNKKESSYLCRCITTGGLLKIVPAGFFKKKTIYYLQANKLSIFIERYKLLIPFLSDKIFIKRLDYNTNEMYTPEGKQLTDAVYHDDLYEIIDELDVGNLEQKGSLLNCINSKLRSVRTDLVLYVKHRIAMDIIFNDLLMVRASEWLAGCDKSKLYGSNLTVVIRKRSHWARLVIQYARKREIPFVYYNSLSLSDSELIKFIYYLLNLYVIIIKSFLNFRQAKPLKTGAKVGIPFYAQNNFTEFNSERNYYLFWYPESNVDQDRIVIYLSDNMSTDNLSLSSVEKKNIESMGFKLLSMKSIFRKTREGVAQYQCSLKVVILAFQYLKVLIKLSCRIRNRAGYEEFKILSKLFIQLPYWEDFFSQNNIKIKFRFDEMFSHRDIAAKLSDVVVISYQYSNHSSTIILHQDICDTFFIWGKEYEKLYSNEHSACNNIIQSGYIFDYLFNKIGSSDNPIGMDLTNNNIDFIISIFDEGFGTATNVVCAIKEEMITFYGKIFKYALRRGNGIIIKPKKNDTLFCLRSSEKTSDLLIQLEQENKIKILDSSKSPVVAGKASDIVIGLIADSTAALECCLSGIPSILYDCSKKGDKHPVYKWGRNKVVFDDITIMIKHIEEFRENRAFKNGFADWSSVLHDKDPFQDGKANQRIGFYINSLILNMDNGSTKEEALGIANRMYSQRFGSDKVRSVFRTDGNVLKS